MAPATAPQRAAPEHLVAILPKNGMRMAGDGIVLRPSEDPRPGPKEILTRVRASSLKTAT
jgi:hypothetical protein